MALEAGILTEQRYEFNRLDVLPDEAQEHPVTYVDYSGKLRYRWAFINFGFRSTQYSINATSFRPYLQRYDIGFGVQFHDLTIGFSHWCEHPVTVESSIFVPLDRGEQSVYIRWTPTWEVRHSR